MLGGLVVVGLEKEHLLRVINHIFFLARLVKLKIDFTTYGRDGADNTEPICQILNANILANLELFTKLP